MYQITISYATFYTVVGLLLLALLLLRPFILGLISKIKLVRITKTSCKNMQEFNHLAFTDDLFKKITKSDRVWLREKLFPVVATSHLQDIIVNHKSVGWSKIIGTCSMLNVPNQYIDSLYRNVINPDIYAKVHAAHNLSYEYALFVYELVHATYIDPSRVYQYQNDGFVKPLISCAEKRLLQSFEVQIEAISKKIGGPMSAVYNINDVLKVIPDMKSKITLATKDKINTILSDYIASESGSDSVEKDNRKQALEALHMLNIVPKLKVA